MNYSDEILENKTFNFFKQLMYNIALAICIMLLGVIILVYGFKFKLYNVLSDSQAPYFVTGDMVVVKAQDEYKVGDIVKFNINGKPITHRLIAIMPDGSGTTRYICHGDNVQNLDGSGVDQKYEDDVEFLKGKTFADITDESNGYSILIQAPKFEQIEGKVVLSASNYGDYFNFIKSHYMLIVALVAGIWCISSVVQNELDIKKTRRLF